jgi:ATP-binding cassette, subfamily B, bacterial PglK
MFRNCLQVLPKSDRNKILVVIIVQISLGLLDLAGVALLGILGALSVSGVQSRGPKGWTASALEFFQIDDMSFQRQAATIALTAASLLILRTILSILFTRRILAFLSRRGAYVSSELMKKVLNLPLTGVNHRSSQDTIYSVTSGVNNITLGVIGTSVSVVADVSLLLILSIGLFVVNPIIAIVTFFIFSGIGLVIYKVLHEKARILGEEQTHLNIFINQKILEIIFGYREAFVRGRRGFYERVISDARFRLSTSLAESNFLPYIGKYVIETSIILGALLISAIQFLISDAIEAVSTLAIFLAAGTRIAPAVLRLQQGGLQIRASLGGAKSTLELIEELRVIPELPDLQSDEISNRNDFNGEVRLTEVSYRYPGADNLAIRNVSFSISQGSSLGIIGSSGSGKTTLADLILGLLEPMEGQVSISGVTPLMASLKWPGIVAYVPQEPILIDGTIRENITLGFDGQEISEETVQESIQVSQLSDFINQLPHGLDTNVGERGSRVSGGQKQRLAIARALSTNPKLIILDEATSSLDLKTEAEIAKSLDSLKGKVTMIVIAHRLSTVKDFDHIIYMSQGKIIATGSFEAVRAQVAALDDAARLSGL